MRLEKPMVLVKPEGMSIEQWDDALATKADPIFEGLRDSLQEAIRGGTLTKAWELWSLALSGAFQDVAEANGQHELAVAVNGGTHR
eukprot:1806677-Alexandrium_andersonii.AAC.1